MGADRWRSGPVGRDPARCDPRGRAASAIPAERHAAERAAQGLPAHLEDPAVAARVVALLLPAGSMRAMPSRRRRTRAVKAGGAT